MSDVSQASTVFQAIEGVWKNESARLIAGIARVTRDIGIAEELAQDALVSALEQWPEQGIPENPGAWLMKSAKWRAIDSLRRAQNLVPKHEEITRELEAQQQRLGEEVERSFDQVIDDDILRLLFTACHPVLAIEGRIALTLRILGGLSTTEIARAFSSLKRRWANALRGRRKPSPRPTCHSKRRARMSFTNASSPSCS